MKKVILVILLLILLVLVYNTDFEHFMPKGYHNCYPYSSNHNAQNSYATDLKGWCTTGEYNSNINDRDFPSIYQRSDLKCPDNYVRATGKESIMTDSKSFCLSPS